MMYSTAAMRSFLESVVILLGAAADTAVGEFQKTAERNTCLIYYEWLLDAHLSFGKLILDDSIALIMWVG
jgi:hypothetical protein